MGGLISKRITAIWLLLLGATALSVGLARALLFRGDDRFVSLAVVIIAFVKVRFVGLDFMELRTAALPLRFVFEAWLVLVCVTILSLYWAGV